MKTDYLIVGQGLGGSLMAEELINRGKKIVVVDNSHHLCSSLVAAGLYNPIVFKRFVESWMTDELLPVADEVYSRIEANLKTQFYHKKNIFKIFASEDEKTLWLKKSMESVYMSKNNLEPIQTEEIENIHGGGLVLDSGYLGVAEFLISYRNYLKKEGLLIEDRVEKADLKITENSITWKKIEAEKIIFCEGSSYSHNPFFSWLPFKLTKGEVLTIKAPLLNSNYVVNKGVFVLPVGNGLFKVGATYEWQDLSEEITEKGKAELLEKLTKILKIPFEIIEHKAGVRPTVSDRRPLIGIHPEHKAVAVFNGLGTKGVMIAPYFAKHFADHLENNTDLNKEVDINRYVKHYFTK